MAIVKSIEIQLESDPEHCINLSAEDARELRDSLSELFGLITVLPTPDSPPSLTPCTSPLRLPMFDDCYTGDPIPQPPYEVTCGPVRSENWGIVQADGDFTVVKGDS